MLELSCLLATPVQLRPGTKSKWLTKTRLAFATSQLPHEPSIGCEEWSWRQPWHAEIQANHREKNHELASDCHHNRYMSWWTQVSLKKSWQVCGLKTTCSYLCWYLIGWNLIDPTADIVICHNLATCVTCVHISNHSAWIYVWVLLLGIQNIPLHHHTKNCH